MIRKNWLGITLIELMVVIGLMSMVLGGMVAVLKRSGRVNETTAVVYEIRSMLARARNTAITKNQRVEVGFDLLNNQVLSYIRRTIAYLHFEDDVYQENYAQPDMFTIAGPASATKASKNGNVFIQHYVGRDRNSVCIGSNSTPGYLMIPYTDVFDCPKGVSLSCDFKLDDPVSSEMVLISRGDWYYIGLDEFGRLQGYGIFQGQMQHKNRILGSANASGETAAQSIAVRTFESVSLGKWHHVEMTFSALGLRISLDGVMLEVFRDEELAQNFAEPLIDPVEQLRQNIDTSSFFLPRETSTPLTIGGRTSNDMPFNGYIDNVEIAQIEQGEVLTLPTGSVFETEFGGLNEIEDFSYFSETYNFGKIWAYFDTDGFLDPSFHSSPIKIFVKGKNGDTGLIELSIAGLTN